MIYLHMPACQQPAGLHSQCRSLGEQLGCMQQGRSQPGTSRRRRKTAAADPLSLGPHPLSLGPLGPPQLFCCAAGWCLAGCGPAACGPAAFFRQGAAEAALLAAGMQACDVEKLEFGWPVKPRSALLKLIKLE